MSIHKCKENKHVFTYKESTDQGVRRREELTKLLTITIENSTVIPFKWQANGFLCFYCGCPFTDSSALKHHTKAEHENAKLKTILRTTVAKSGSIKLDVSELACKKCGETMRSLQHFFNHIKQHGFIISEEASHCCYPFILTDNDMSCLECGMSFRFFGPLLIHTHKYHTKSEPFICEICGQGFIAKANVENHRKIHDKKSDCNYHCKECDETFSTQYKLTYHFEKVHTLAKFKCPKCPEVLGSKYLKKRHLAIVHDVKSAQFKCDECQKIFSLKNKLLLHKSCVHLKERNIACEICGHKVFSKDHLKRHMVKHDDARPFECEFCKKTFQRKKTLEFHRRIHTNDKRYQCKECGRSFVQWTSLKLHMRVHHSNPKKHELRVPTQIEWQKAAARRYVHSVLTHSSLLPFRWRGNRYICFYCHYTFTEATCLRTHTRTHQNLAIMKHLTQTRDFAPIKVDIGETLKCLKCKHEDDSLEGLIKHLKTHKLIGDTEQECFLPFKLADHQISCLKCAKSYQSFGMLYSHMNKVHLEGTKRICEACGESFFSDFSLRKHVQSHHSNSDFKCSHCNEKFKLDANRISHEYKEHNIKSFKCYKCDEMFGSHYLRRLHLHSTHMKMEFTCKECSKTFLSKSLLNRHVNRVHLKEKKFACPVCGDKFFDLGTLNVHAKKHSYSQQKSFQCKVCSLVFGGKVELSDHMVTHAGQSLSLK
ncbi:oocyte zinc finger protein XlCOF6-like [Cydia fagiglandana]|uniref:oocyte zinc finger protein XlCOF6-like n=1 Tax=Cydia fagiglandana TaxID=1458189 RepID=UPI002FEE5E2B